MFSGKLIVLISKQIHLVGKHFRLKIHQNNQFLLFVETFGLYQRLSSEEEAGTSSSGSWHDENLNLTYTRKNKIQNGSTLHC